MENRLFEKVLADRRADEARAAALEEYDVPVRSVADKAMFGGINEKGLWQ